MAIKKVLVVVDMQIDFISGSLGTKEAQRIVQHVVSKIKNCGPGTLVILTKDTHKENYLDTQEGRNLPVKHCIEGTPGWSICDEVSNAVKHNPGIILYSSRDVSQSRVKKDRFGSVDLANIIKQYEDSIESIELVGLCTDVCVISNAILLKAFMPEVPIIVDASCCAGVTPESHKNALQAMKMCQIHIINEEDAA